MAKTQSWMATVIVVGLLMSACDDTDEQPRSAPPSPTPSATREPSEDGPFDPNSLELDLEPVVERLEAPLFVTHAGDGSGRIFIVEQGGTIQVLGSGEPETFLDISNLIVAGGEQGLLGLAFHPEYSRNGLFYVNYTDTNGDTVVAEYHAPPDGGRADSSSARVLLQIEQPFANHNGGALAFGPDGYLYIATGDGGSGGDPQGNGQRLDTLLGKLLRIDVDRGTPYAIPADNPFTKEEGARPEIWAYGLRNPWRFSFDFPSKTLWIGDVGQGALEEIDRVEAARGGLNFGWNEMEGDECFTSGCDPSEFELPVAVYGREGANCTVISGYVYRGEASPAMTDGYFFGDFCTGRIWALSAERSGRQDEVELLNSDLSISSFGVDEQGEIYLTDLGSGQVFRLVGREK